MMKTDFTIEEIRKTRKEISAQNEHNAQKLVSYYIDLQKKYEARPPKKENLSQTEKELEAA